MRMLLVSLPFPQVGLLQEGNNFKIFPATRAVLASLARTAVANALRICSRRANKTQAR